MKFVNSIIYNISVLTNLIVIILYAYNISCREMNEAFAVVPLHCADQLGINHDILNVNGGAISIGHPFGMTGSRQVSIECM